MSYEQEYRKAKRKGDVRKVREMRDNPEAETPHHPETLGEPSHPEHAE